MSNNSALEISNLLYRYAEYIDSGDLQGAASLFQHATIKTNEQLVDAEGLLAVWRQVIQIYPCGTPRTKHVVSNPIIEIDELAKKATCRSYYTVFQCTDKLPLQPVAAGRYHDEFECVEGQWRFSYRDYSKLDFLGDLSAHLKNIEL
ncbi:nuclear transport factor 2 family protein [Parahaliea sp. F7430]|uniref:Nuclear transport factor 2 family protein n=1 Tax=Sediminihaliea albiluteola TaxID=2758564 RepID=A0A7W2TYB8_9GAMM|nr:nuclear transport factor 2 family protein [Sediminihaliea albiluteola]MBA6414218.1 nuclear transport factor 2 family protein [Sediminihaliea albiluteola]